MRKNNIFVTILSIISLLAIVAFSTYAYLENQGTAIQSTEAEIVTETVDRLSFSINGNLEMDANETNFMANNGSVVASADVKASLKASETTKNISARYSIYLKIDYNDFEYISGTSPELLLTIISPSGSKYSLESGTHSLPDYMAFGITDKSNTKTFGYDITEYNGVIPIVGNYPISSTGDLVEQTWKINITFLNMNRNQNANIGKRITAEIIIEKDELDNYCNAGDNLSTCLIGYYEDTSFQTNRMYHHDENLDYGANDASYRYNGATNNYICFNEDDPVHAYKKDWCSSNNLYRIIGIFKENIKQDDSWLETNNYQLKVVKNNAYYSSVYYYGTTVDENGTNDWSSSLINTSILNDENSYYLASLGDSWKEKIALHNWIIGGISSSDITNSANLKLLYDAEIGAYKNDVNNQYEAKIAMPYITDYLYDSYTTYWNKNYRYCEACLYSPTYYIGTKSFGTSGGNNMWAITQLNDDSNTFIYDYKRYDYYNQSKFDGTYNLRANVYPTFYLNSNVTYQGGTGTSSDPIRIG